MALAYDQQTVQARSSGVDSLAMSVGQAVDAGDLLVVCVSTFFTNGTAGTWTVSGSLNGGYTEAVDVLDSVGSQGAGAVFYFQNSAAGTETVTVNPNGTSADIDFTFSEVSGAATSAALDVVNETQGTTGSPSVASGALAQADEILFALAVGDPTGGTISPDATYTQIGENENSATGEAYSAQYKIVASAASDTADWTFQFTGGVWGACIAAFKQAAAGGGGVVTPRLLGLLGVGAG